MENILNLNEEEKIKLKINYVDQYNLEMKRGYTNIEFYNYGDGDYEITIDDGNTNGSKNNYVLKANQLEALKAWLNLEIKEIKED